MDDWSEIKNVLCIRLDNLGDVLMAEPAIRALKQQTSGRKITLLTSFKGAGVAKFMGCIDKILIFDAPWVKANNPSVETVNIIEELKKYQFEAAVIFTNYSQNPMPSAMLCFLANIPKVLSYCRENPYKLITNWVPDKEPFKFPVHGVERQLDLVKKVGAKIVDSRLSVNIPWNLKSQVMQKLSKIGLDLSKEWLIVHPGASETKRQYPTELFIEAIKKMINKLNYQIVLTGDLSEKNIAAKFKKELGNRVLSAVGELNLGELIVLIKMAKLLISNNTGPVHIAAALQTPVVDLYARTNVEHIPWKVKSKVLYFDIPKNLQSKNEILRFAGFQGPRLKVLPDNIVNATLEILDNKSFVF